MEETEATLFGIAEPNAAHTQPLDPAPVPEDQLSGCSRHVISHVFFSPYSRLPPTRSRRHFGLQAVLALRGSRGVARVAHVSAGRAGMLSCSCSRWSLLCDFNGTLQSQQFVQTFRTRPFSNTVHCQSKSTSSSPFCS